MGPEEHRRRIEAMQGGKLKKYGSPNQAAMDRALPGQLATCLNTLRFVDALHTVLGRELVRRRDAAAGLDTDDAATGAVAFNELFDWHDGALQQRFSSAAQYLRSGKKFGLLTFEGEYPVGGVLLVGLCLGATRQQLLETALSQPQLIVPSMTQPGDAERLERDVHALPRLPQRAGACNYA